MNELWEGYSALEKVFFCSAVTGGSIFIFWMVLQLLAGTDGGLDTDASGADVGHGDTHFDDGGGIDPGFKVLSSQGLSSFFTMFGVVGLALSRRDVGPVGSAMGGLCGGALMVYAMAMLFGFLMKMQSSGSLQMKNAVGQEGTVYLKISADGTGQARINMQARLEIFDAISDNKVELTTGTRVKVTRVVSGNTIAVVKI